MAKRVAVSKKTRFEVFKRDRFRCQYCGATSPDVLLHIDHIHPVCDDGGNEVENLITACPDCNHGKGAMLLGDRAVAEKTRDRLDELAEQREQLDMLLEWKRELVSFKDKLLDHVAGYWESIAIGWSITPAGRTRLRKLLLDFTPEEITEAMDIAAFQYFRYEGEGSHKVTGKSWSEAFSKIGGIAYNRRERGDGRNG